MKTSKPVYFLLLVCLLSSSCTKPIVTGYTPAESMAFVFIGKDGKSLVTSLKDSVKVSYIEADVTKFQNLVVQKLYVNYGDTTKVATKYNGLVINDGKFMSQISSRTGNPIRNFTIYLNGVNMGTIYIDYWAYQDVYPALSSKYLTFNNIPTKEDREGDYFSQGSPINFLPVQ